MRNCDGSKWRWMTSTRVSWMRSCLFLKPRYKVIGVTWAWRATSRTEDPPKPCLENSRIADSRILHSAFVLGLGFFGMLIKYQRHLTQNLSTLRLMNTTVVMVFRRHQIQYGQGEGRRDFENGACAFA